MMLRLLVRCIILFQAHIFHKGAAMQDDVIASLHKRLIVSVQAYPGEPMRNPETMAQVAQSAELGGAAAIRCQGLCDISAIKSRVEIPVIGLWKEGHDGVYITPTLRHACACIHAGCDIVALDATDRKRPDGRTFEQTVREIRETHDTLLMADCASFSDIERAVHAGCDICSTTLSHGCAAIDHKADDGPDLELVYKAHAAFPDTPIVCEGSVHTPKDLRNAFEAGAYSVVVGTAITHPTSLTSWFAQACPKK